VEDEEKTGHWYTASGEPRHDATMAVARKERLLPSVTTILKIIAKPELERWMKKQAIMTALGITMYGGESKEAFAERALRADEKDKGRSPELGKRLHKMAEDIARGFDPDDIPEGYASMPIMLRSWMSETFDDRIPEAAVVGNGYAGTCDLYGTGTDMSLIVADYKSQMVKPYKGNVQPRYYSTFVYQIAAYAEALFPGMPVTGYSVILNTNPEVDTKIFIKRYQPDKLKEAFLRFLYAKELWYAENGF
jgi:hypothetical protein